MVENLEREDTVTMKDIKIKDLYPGKPDAKDEVNFESSDTFIKM